MNGEDHILTEDEIVSTLTRECTDRFGLPPREVIDAHFAGREVALRGSGETCEVHDVAMDLIGLAFLLPEDHPLHAKL